MALQKELEEKNDAIDSKRKCVGLREIPHGIESGRAWLRCTGIRRPLRGG
jgi:hypothetical protein